MYLEGTPGNPPKPTRHVCIPKWRERIYWAFRFGSFTAKDKTDAGDWHYCAIGEASSIYSIARTFKHQPFDDDLEILGLDFYKAVYHDNPTQALALLSQIERRLIELDSVEV